MRAGISHHPRRMHWTSLSYSLLHAIAMYIYIYLLCSLLFPSYITSSTSSVVSLKYVTKHGPPLHHIIIYHNTSQMHIYIYNSYIYTVHIEHYWTCILGSDVISRYHWCINWHGHHGSQGAPLPAHRLEAPAKLGPRQPGLAIAAAPADDSWWWIWWLYNVVQICTDLYGACSNMFGWLCQAVKPFHDVNVCTHDHTLYTTCYIYIFWQLFSLGTGDGRCLRLTLRSSRVKETSKASWATWHREECA